MLPELMSNCLHDLRKWKYDDSVVQHWVETQWSGQIVKKDNEKVVTEEAAKEASEMAQASLTFESGNDASLPASSAAGAADDVNVAWPKQPPNETNNEAENLQTLYPNSPRVRMPAII